jgi:LacI family transcriptional regulator
MMAAKLKVAVVSASWNGYVYSLTRGATSFIDANVQGVIRDFRLPRKFGHSLDAHHAITQLRNWDPDGLLCFTETEMLRELIRLLPRPLPIVAMCAVERLRGVALVTGSFVHQMEVAVRHLRQQGFRSMAFLVLENPESDSTRIDVFHRIASPAEPGLATLVEAVDHSLLEDPDMEVAPVPRRLAAWLRRLPKPVGVICVQNGGGGYIIRVCHALGLRVPEDVAVIGTDDTDLSLSSTPTLTCVVPAGETIGFEAMRVLQRMMRGQPAPRETVRVKGMGLRVRQSTGLKRVEICDIAAAMEYINQNACKRISVGQLIQETQHVSRWTFQKHFQAATGQTARDVIRQRKFQEARRLLRTTELSITLIAEQCGFSASNEFARAFRAVERKSPSAYRKDVRTSDH